MILDGRIDVHCHTVPPAYRAAVSGLAKPSFVRLPEWSPQTMMDTMDRHGIATAIPSISVPGVHFGDDAAAASLARACNDDMADCKQRWLGRFGGFAVLPLPAMEEACREAERALDELRLTGIGLFTSYEGRYLGDSFFEPLLQLLDDRRAIVFIHPAAPNMTVQGGLNLPPFAIEYPFDTTRTAVSLILSGALDRFPHIRFILSHAGGTLPFLSYRVATLSERLLAAEPLVSKYDWPLLRGDHGQLDGEMVYARIRRFWFDVANAAGEQVMTCLRMVADPTRILFGSDWPYVPAESVGDAVMALDDNGSLSTDDQQRIFRRNAEDLLAC